MIKQTAISWIDWFHLISLHFIDLIFCFLDAVIVLFEHLLEFVHLVHHHQDLPLLVGHVSLKNHLSKGLLIRLTIKIMLIDASLITLMKGIALIVSLLALCFNLSYKLLKLFHLVVPLKSSHVSVVRLHSSLWVIVLFKVLVKWVFIYLVYFNSICSVHCHVFQSHS